VVDRKRLEADMPMLKGRRGSTARASAREKRAISANVSAVAKTGHDAPCASPEAWSP